MTHSPEPWTIYNKAPQIVDRDGVHFLDISDIRYENTLGRDDPVEDLRRIVAAVNACTGIPTERLEGMKLVHAVEALELIDKGGGNIDCESYCGVYHTLEKINDD